MSNLISFFLVKNSSHSVLDEDNVFDSESLRGGNRDSVISPEYEREILQVSQALSSLASLLGFSFKIYSHFNAFIFVSSIIL